MTIKKRSFAKNALILSVCLLILWGVLGTGTTLAWFTDTTPSVKNTFVVGDLELDVFYKNDTLTDYAPVDADTAVFNDKALYEPGYTQVAYLRVVNNGDIPFQYKVSVDRFSFVDSVNVLGGRLHLPEHLRYGVLFGSSEAELTRQIARINANKEMLDVMRLNQYSQADETEIPVGGERYVALIVYMPEETTNEANYMKNATVPTVDLGLTVFAQQAGTSMAQ